MNITAQTLMKLEDRILNKKPMLDFSDNANIRFCVAHIVLKAIALTKDPTVDNIRVKDLFDLASEIMAMSDIKNDESDRKLRDLIDAMIEGDDIGLQVRRQSAKMEAVVSALDAKLMYKANIIEEGIKIVQETTLTNQKLLEDKKTKKRFFSMGFLYFMLAIAFLFAIVSATVIIGSYMISLSQPKPLHQTSSKSSKIIYDDLDPTRDYAFNPQFLSRMPQK